MTAENTNASGLLRGMFTREEFLTKMHVEELDTLLFRGDALQMGLPRVFGGQVLGQALNAGRLSQLLPDIRDGYFRDANTWIRDIYPAWRI